MNSQNLKSADFIWHSDIDFSVKSTESSQSRIERVWSVGSGNDDNVASSFKTVHQCQKLGDNSSLDFTVDFLSVRCNRVDFINENNGGAIFLSLFEGFSKISFSLTSHLRHNLWSIDQKEEGAGFVGDSSGNQGLSRSRGTVQENSSWGLDT